MLEQAPAADGEEHGLQYNRAWGGGGWGGDEAD